ncbi:MAG: LysR family transcriptional regulator [Rhodanobacter sp.]
MSERDLPPLNALRAFEAAARFQSVTRAAEALHVTHGAVSRQLRVLEDALGQPLFMRQGRGLSLTQVGQQLRDGAGAAFDQLRDTWTGLQLSSRGPFVLGCSGSVLARWVIPRLDRLQRDLPDLALHLTAQETPLSPNAGEVDAALMLAAPPWPANWQVDVLAPERMGPVVSPRYAGWLQLQGRPAEALINEPVLHTVSRPQAWSDWAKAENLSAAPSGTGQGFAHLYYLLEAALAGLGIAIAPEPLVAEDLAAGRLLAPWGFRETDAAWVLATPRRARDARTQALVSWLKNELAGG